MIELLDCTLRDGGYVNNWSFGKNCINDFSSKLVDAKIDIVELGFLKNDEYNQDRTVYNNVDLLNPLLKKNTNTKFAAMIDVQNRIPIEMITNRNNNNIDIIRVIVWKRLLDEDFAYCQQIVNKGYKLCVQPARVDQYSDEEFKSMILQFSKLNPYAIYIVDSWGTLTIEKVMHYFTIATSTLTNNIALGYHGHNNLQQAFGIAETLANTIHTHNLILDSSISGMGRGAGNLNTETIASYLNSKHKRDFNISVLIDLFTKYIKPASKTFKWGASFYMYLTALLHCNPEYGILCENLKLNEKDTFSILNSLEGENRIRFNKDAIYNLVKQVKEVKC